MEGSLIVSPTADPHRFRLPDGQVHALPDGWALLPPGDAGLTRRVKAAGPTWTVQEKKGRKTFSRGVWAPARNIETARAALEVERADPAYARRRASDARRREVKQVAYVEEFAQTVREFLAFAPVYGELARKLAEVVAAHATPVGSGTVARTQRIPVQERAEAAVIAWLRHQTTAYDDLKIARVKGERRRVRQQLARVSRALLDAHRVDRDHDPAACALCRALAG